MHRVLGPAPPVCDRYPLGSAAFTCDTLGMNPGERWDVMIDCNNPGVGFPLPCPFGMVTALIVE